MSSRKSSSQFDKNYDLKYIRQALDQLETGKNSKIQSQREEQVAKPVPNTKPYLLKKSSGSGNEFKTRTTDEIK
jgi:hypothetical protein